MMTTANDARKAHKLLDELDARAELSQEQEKLLRSFLPELPKQMTLEEITERVYDAWTVASGNDWGGNSYDADTSIDDWLWELYKQLHGLKDTPTSSPALPDGMRLADHEEYGRCVASPRPDNRGDWEIVFATGIATTGTGLDYVHSDTLTFIDAEPVKPAHPEFLETEADYQNAPEGTIVALDGTGTIWLKKFGAWRNTAGDHGVESACIALDSRRVLRWGWGK